MRFNLLVIALAVSALSTQPHTASAGTVTTDGADMVIKTKGGFEAKTTDDRFSFKLGGRVQVQADAFKDSMNLIDGDGAYGSDLFFRRARVYLSGTVYEHWAYKIQFNVVDSGSGGGTVEDLYIRWKRYPWANLTVGKHKEPFSLEELTSSKYVTSIERSPINDFFAEGRSLGISLQGASSFWGYGVGIFDNNDQFSNSGRQKWAYTGRIFLSPINSERALLHLGAGYSWRNADDDADEVYDGGEVTQGIRKGDDVAISVDPIESQRLFALELAGKIASFHGAAEFHQRNTDAADTIETGDPLMPTRSGNNAKATGYYVQAAWIITGESRPYKKGKWNKIKPQRPGLGAWEIFVKNSGVNLDDSGIDAQNRNKSNISTLGVNWYPNDILRVSANYVYTKWDEDLVSPLDTSGKAVGELWRADYVANSDDYTAGSDALNSGHGFSMRFQAAF